jgi:hypothetical protein
MWGKVKIVAGLTNINKQMLELLVKIGLCIVFKQPRSALFYFAIWLWKSP